MLRGGLLALALLAAGCAGDEASNGYVAALNQTQERFARELTRLSDGVTATSTPAQDRRTLSGYEDAVDRAVSDLRRMDPPDDVASLHGSLIRQVGGYRTAVQRFRARLTSEDPQEVLEAQAAFSRAQESITQQVGRTVAGIGRELRGP